MKNYRSQRGYSLMEMLVVVAIIGILMLVTIPNFITMRKSTIVKGSMRQFTNDLRAARQRAVTQSSFVRVMFVNKGRQYYIVESLDNGTTWNYVGSNPRWLADSVYAENSAGPSQFTDSIDDIIASKDLGDLPDIIFQRTGTARVPNGIGQVLIKTTWTEVPKPLYTISIRTTGMVSVN
jgi:prepilin-type N-terminal cleavage/methylation domain-containing protein